MGHTLIALAIQSIIGLLTGQWWAGAAAGSAYFVGREFAQAEYRYIEANGGFRYKTPQRPEVAVLHPRWWNRKSVLDWVLPTAAVVVVAFVMQ
jgi:hypothetical protein